MKTYGNQIPGATSVIGRVETSLAGNVVVRVGQPHKSGWTQIAHVVLTQDEALALGDEIYALVAGEEAKLRGNTAKSA